MPYITQTSSTVGGAPVALERLLELILTCKREASCLGLHDEQSLGELSQGLSVAEVALLRLLAESAIEH